MIVKFFTHGKITAEHLGPIFHPQQSTPVGFPPAPFRVIAMLLGDQILEGSGIDVIL